MLVANSELAIKRGDYDAAIMMLSSVPSSSPAFTKAQMVKADIFLQYRKDKTQYARCYQVRLYENIILLLLAINLLLLLGTCGNQPESRNPRKHGGSILAHPNA